ncbi:transposase [Streptomyces sp. Mg1]|nr:transposase [Streptomyces sp. Mg1]
MHVLSDAAGLPIIVGLSAANTHDSQALKPMVLGHQTRHDPHRGRPPRYVFRGPAMGPLASGPGMAVSPLSNG